MSDTTAAALDDAVRAHFADKHPGQLVIGWAVVAATTNDDDGFTSYDTDAPDWQPAHHTLGLLRLGMDLVLNGGDQEDQ